MCCDYKQLQVEDDLPDLGDGVLEEEMTILAPHFAKKLTEALGQTDGGRKHTDESSSLRQGQHRKAGRA